MTLDALLQRFKGVRPAGNGYVAFCPAHDDHHRSLSINLGDDGRILLKCHANHGCTTESIVASVRVTMADLYPDGSRGNGAARRSACSRKPIQATYDYTDEQGKLLYQVVRYEDKAFRQRRPDGRGGWTWDLKDTQRVLYRLPKVVNATATGETTYICEGEKDADQLAAFGLCATTNSGGAGKWRDEYGSVLTNATVVILPDNDDAGRDHAAKVVRSLHRVGATVKVLLLPDLFEKGDVSDWLAAGGTKDLLLRLVHDCEYSHPDTVSGSKAGRAQSANGSKVKADDPGLVKLLADAILEQDHFARDSGGVLYRLAGGVYTPDGERYVELRVKKLLIEWQQTAQWSSHRANQVATFICVDAPELWEMPPDDTLNCLNGLVDVTSRILRPHDPAFLSTTQISVNYDPSAECPEWDQFCGQVFPPDAVADAVPYKIIASVMLPGGGKQKACLCAGEGSNGKSSYLTAVSVFVGKKNVSNLSLHRLESDRFSVSRLVGKLVNICPDLPSQDLMDTSIFKALTGDDSITGEYKFKPSFEFKPYAKLVFSANNPPKSRDATHAFFRRWYVVPFDRTFSESEQIPRHVLDASLADPSELSGVLNKALAVLSEVRVHGVIETPSMKFAWNEFRNTTDPLVVWLDTCTEFSPNAIISKTDLRNAYNDHAAKNGNPVMGEKAFGGGLKHHRSKVTECQRLYGGKEKTWCWRGIALKDAVAGCAEGHVIHGIHGMNHTVPEIDSNGLLEETRGSSARPEDYSEEEPVNAVNGVNLIESPEPQPTEWDEGEL